MIKKQAKRITHFFREKRVPFSWRRIWIVVITVGIVLGVVLTGFVAYAKTYSQKVLPGVHVGGIPVGGLAEDEVRGVLQQMTDKLIAEGITFTFDGGLEDLVLYPILVSESNSLELVEIDLDAEVESLLVYRKGGDIFSQGVAAIATRLERPDLALQHVAVDKRRIEEAIVDHIANNQQPAQDAAVVISSVSPLSYEILDAVEGSTYQYEAFVDDIVAAWSRLTAPTVSIVRVVETPTVTKADIEQIIDTLPSVFAGGSLTLEHTDSVTRQKRSWFITGEMIANWLTVHPEGDAFVFGIDSSSTYGFLEDTVAPLVNKDARDAKFSVNTVGRVTEFQGSRPGVAVDRAQTHRLIDEAIGQRVDHDEGLTKVITVAVSTVEPQRKTGDVNDLGIIEVLGVGTSDFSGSPTNRVKNIANAVRKLNGVIIKPGEEFSAIDYTQPYTIEGGYLPELVIKGDEIKPEIGGGLCQVGTTLFRMAMNSGLEITQRRNHSLVVGYYNDPSNGLPGTDATIYDPQPDFKFRNDTDNNILIQTDVDYARSHLIFTIWGTNDGRVGSYTAPVVHQWFTPGPTKEVETTKLAPGERTCQHAYTGADASFTYTRTLANGEAEETVFESHYRPLPEICLVGVEEEIEAGEAEDAGEAQEAEERDEEEFVNPIEG